MYVAGKHIGSAKPHTIIIEEQHAADRKRLFKAIERACIKYTKQPNCDLLDLHIESYLNDKPPFGSVLKIVTTLKSK